MYIAGIKADAVRTSAEGPEFQVGTRGFVNTSAGPKCYVYVRATGTGGITGAGYVGIIDYDFTAAMITTTLAAAAAGAQHEVGVGVTAIAENGYGWLQIYGVCSVRCAAAAAVDTALGTTATAGAVDDVIEDLTKIRGLYLTTAAGGAATVAGFCNFPACDEITNDV